MRKKGIVILTILILLAVPVTLCSWGFLLPACFSETFMGELPEKVRRLDEAEGRRIIVVGGSAAAFGVDSDDLESEFEGYTAVNFGMYAGLGTTAMLDLSEDSIREGDIVIVMPEQQEQALSDYFGAKYFWQAVDGNFGLLARLSRDNLMQAVGAFPAFAADKFSYVANETLPEPDSVYRKSSFAENCDIKEGIADRNRLPGGFDVNTPIVFEAGLMSEEFADRLNAYAICAAKRGAEVLYHFSPMNGKAVHCDTYTSSRLPKYTSDLASRLVCPVIGDPRDSIMDSKYFFDTNFHLTDEGRAIFTDQLVRDIKAYLGDASKTGAGEEKTDGAASEIETGPVMTGETDGFLYEIRDGVCVLTGLTADGGELSDITVPSRIDGYPVEVIAAEAFAGQMNLVRITVPDSVRMIEDHAFEGCTSLEGVVMESGKPETCVVGLHLLDGTDAYVLVPADALSAYRLNYNWSVWAERIVDAGDVSD